MNDEQRKSLDKQVITHHSLLSCRLIIDPPQGGAWNMAVDEALLESAVNDGVATLRFYRCSEPTLSLGYFQKLADREQHPASGGCPVVRRHSGGGAIVHDQEVTYSLALPPDAPQVREAEQVYRRTHTALLAVLANQLAEPGLPLPANLCAAPIKPAGGAEPFLCFQRRARCDVLLPGPDADNHGGGTIDGNHKICGSAQRKRRGAVLQHGSLLLRRSPAAPELPGVTDLCDQPLEADSLASTWAETIAEELSLALTKAQPTDHERRRAEELCRDQFSRQTWTNRR